MGSPAAGNQQQAQGDPGQQAGNQQTQPNQGEPGQQQGQQQNNQQQNGGGDDDAISKAYEKVREVEKQRDAAQAELNKIKRNELPEADRLKQENQDLQNQLNIVTTDLQKFAAERIATNKGFLDPESAVAVLVSRGEDISDKNKAERALDKLAAEKKNLLGQAPPPSGGPVNPQTEQTPSGNQGMNSLIRRVAGRE